MNGLPAATAEAAAGDWVFRIGAVKIGGSMYRLIFADRNNGAAIERALAATLASFHRMTPTEVARLHPLRIDIVAVRRGETVGDLAARMQGTERSLELFRLLNGLGAGRRASPPGSSSSSSSTSAESPASPAVAKRREFLRHLLVDGALERHDQLRHALQPLPAPGAEFRLVLRRRPDARRRSRLPRR